jgi:hypothetical protein
MSRARLVTLLFTALLPATARASFTETVPAKTFVLDSSVVFSWIDRMWDNDGRSASLVEDIERYEPGGGKQGVLLVRPNSTQMLLVNKLQYGVLDSLTLAFGVPLMVLSEVDPGLSWEPGDYMRQIGRSYGEQDFWDWAASMGQPKPEAWSGNRWVLSDLIVGARFRWTDFLPVLTTIEISSALTVSGIIPTGRAPDPEEVVAMGSSMWDLHTQGDLTFHLGFDKQFKEHLDGRLTVGAEVFYEVFFERTRTTPTGARHPLLLTQAPYAGETYRVKPGDFSGFSFSLDTVPFCGPARATWLVGGDEARAANLPPVVTLSVLYSFVHLQQSDWTSESVLWDWEREKWWRPGYKNVLEGRLTVSLLRIGVPLQVYAAFRTLTLIPGKNCRAPDMLTTGLMVPLKLW